jgi:hypothetical protein
LSLLQERSNPYSADLPRLLFIQPRKFTGPWECECLEQKSI